MVSLNRSPATEVGLITATHHFGHRLRILRLGSFAIEFQKNARHTGSVQVKSRQPLVGFQLPGSFASRQLHEAHRNNLTASLPDGDVRPL